MHYMEEEPKMHAPLILHKGGISAAALSPYFQTWKELGIAQKVHLSYGSFM